MGKPHPPVKAVGRHAGRIERRRREVQEFRLWLRDAEKIDLRARERGMKRRLINGLEQDVVYARKWYCYLQNHPAIVKYVKRQINKRERREGRKESGCYDRDRD